ncbi:uncharacterized protein LOC110816422 isoform X2 [Carica papaya]|uniref:uncharacterized protein LOC110816422 isoform X2 n=1 Tax=Carica papaya TaxID=3649 RepID=UPI000B8CDC1A|nr:uncharacterized protein LOC110816422 isoform X2 [Carica papaya]
MFMDDADSLSELRLPKEKLLAEPESELDDEVIDCPQHILYTASFEELASNIIQYDTIIWFSISLLLVLAWGIGIIMLLYLPIKRYVLQRDISSRKLYVTPREIVYKVSRPSYVPCLGRTTFEKRIPLTMVIDIIIEQGWLQSVYGIHTFRIESVAHRKASHVDELQVQGVDNPELLRTVIVTEAAKIMQDVGGSWKLSALIGEDESMSQMGSLTERPVALRSPSKNWKMTRSPHHRATVSGDLLLHKLDEVSRSVKDKHRKEVFGDA